MKMLLCTDIRLGALCTENLDIRLSHKWQAARTEKFAELMDLAVRNHVEENEKIHVADAYSVQGKMDSIP